MDWDFISVSQQNINPIKKRVLRDRNSGLLNWF